MNQLSQQPCRNDVSMPFTSVWPPLALCHPARTCWKLVHESIVCEEGDFSTWLHSHMSDLSMSMSPNVCWGTLCTGKQNSTQIRSLELHHKPCHLIASLVLSCTNSCSAWCCTHTTSWRCLSHVCSGWTKVSTRRFLIRCCKRTDP